MRQDRFIGFDLDGTLVDRDAAVRRLLARWELNLKEIEALMALDLRGYGDRDVFFDALADALAGSESGADVWRRFQVELPSEIQPDPAVLAMLGHFLDSGVQIALLTNGGSALQRAKLNAAGLADCFQGERVLVSGEMAAAKPAPEVFAELVGVLGASSAEQVLYVGDHAANDIVGATRAGLRATMVGDAESPNPEALPAGAIWNRLDSVTDLPEFLDC